MNRQDPAGLRQDYARSGLRRSDLHANPVRQFERWFEEACAADIMEPNAMTLATVSAQGTPSARVVLLKGIEQDGFVFFTNYKSAKAQEIEQNSKVCLSVWWDALQRQVRVNGSAERVSTAASESYFASRPRGSQLGAWASEQSAEIADESVLAARMVELEQTYANRDIPRPPYWGGYVIRPERMEFWQGRQNRLHDRLVYERKAEGWRVIRLAP